MNRTARATWRAQQQRDLLEFASRGRLAEGFGWLDERGVPQSNQPLQLWINARMTYVFSLATLQGVESAATHAAHGVAALRTLFTDPVHGGWFDALDDVGRTAKTSYGHAFVLLAGATATAAGVPGAAALFADARRIVTDRFWDPDAGRCVERYQADWSSLEAYRGANSNMHQCEAFLAAGRVSGDPAWHTRAESIARAVIDGDARRTEWRVPEHFDPSWRALPDYNRENPADPFRPYGATVGHWFEWARLLITLDQCLPDPPPAGWWTTLPRCSTRPSPSAGPTMARSASRTRSTGPTRWSSTRGCTGSSARRYSPRTHFTDALARNSRADSSRSGGRASSGSSPIRTAAAGGTRWMRPAGRRGRSGPASRTSTTRTRRCCCPTCRSVPRNRPDQSPGATSMRTLPTVATLDRRVGLRRLLEREVVHGQAVFVAHADSGVQDRRRDVLDGVCFRRRIHVVEQHELPARVERHQGADRQCRLIARDPRVHGDRATLGEHLGVEPAVGGAATSTIDETPWGAIRRTWVATSSRV